MRTIILLALSINLILAAKISPLLEQKIQQLGTNETLNVLIHLKSNSLPDFRDWSYQAKRDYIKKERFKSQESLLNRIDYSLQPKQYWIGNLIRIRITQNNRNCLQIIANHPDVDWIIEDFEIVLEDDFENNVIVERSGIEWNIKTIKAPEVWLKGYTGKGIVIGFLDSGIDSSHPDLRNRIRKFEGAKNFTPFPGSGFGDDTLENKGHGTHVVGIACGENGIGVAPGAECVMAKIFHNRKSQLTWILDAFEWMAEMEDPPDIISNSWGSPYPWYVCFFEPLWTLRQLGFIIVFANGNWGPDTATAGTPGNYPHVIGVGATDTLNLVAWFSSRGPSYRGDQWNGYGWADQRYWPYSEWNFMKPDICAPGVYICSSFPGGGYKVKMGTSMAAPHIAGVIALLLEKQYTLTHQEVYNILIHSTEQPAEGGKYPNYNYGWGIVNALKAIESIKIPEDNNLIKVYPTVLTNQQKLRVNFIFQIQKAAKVDAAIYDQAGRLVKRIINHEYLSAGQRKYFWDGQDANGQTVNTGIYFLMLKIDQKQFSRKIIFLEQKKDNIGGPINFGPLHLFFF